MTMRAAFFSAKEYRNGHGVRLLVCLYLALTAVLIISAFLEGPDDGTYVMDFAFLTTLPVSLGVEGAYAAIETARGVPAADQGGGTWMLLGYTGCALVNAYVLWVVFRGWRTGAE